jgi:hypothetical protein
MNRFKKITAFLLIMMILAVIYFLYPYILSYGKPDLVPVFSGDPISFTRDETLHFFPDGLILCGTPSRFYNERGVDIMPPLKQDDLSAEGGSVNVIAHTENYIATASGRIYNTESVPFALIYENKDIQLWDLKEYEDFLLLLIQNDEAVVEPFILVHDSDFLISLDGTGESKYISADSYKASRELSLLTVSLDSPVPFSRVFHYVNRNELYGVLSLEDEFIYNIFRQKSNIVLIGIKDILCYNIDGKLQWSLSNESNGLFQAIPGDNGLLLYFPEAAKLGNEKGNALFIRSNGRYSVEQFPRYLSNLQAYQSGYIGLEYKNTLVFINKNGKAIKRQRLPESVNLLQVHPYHTDSIYVRMDSGSLQLYTADKQEEQ